MSKEKLRQRIAEQTAEYLASGGVIEQVPRKPFCPKSMMWAQRRGFDYQPWCRVGSAEHLQDSVQVDEGCYVKKTFQTGD
jgi:hypothetical protein